MGNKKNSTLLITLLVASAVFPATSFSKATKAENYQDALNRANAACHIKIDSQANPEAFSECLTDEMKRHGFVDGTGDRKGGGGASASISIESVISGLLNLNNASANDVIAAEPTPWGVYMETEAGNDQQYMPPEYVKAEVDAQLQCEGLRYDAFGQCYRGAMSSRGYPDAPVLYEGLQVGEQQ